MMAESFNYHRALSWEKSPAVKRLIVFESPSEGRKWANGRDNWAADSWVDYGLLRLSKGEKKRRWEREEGEKEKGKGRVVRCSRRGLSGLLLQPRELQPCLAREVTPDPSHAPPCSRCKPSLLAAHTPPANFSHTLQALGGKRCMKTQILFTFSPPPAPFPSCHSIVRG